MSSRQKQQTHDVILLALATRVSIELLHILTANGQLWSSVIGPVTILAV